MKRTSHVATNFLNLNDFNAALAAVNAFSDLSRYTHKGQTLHVFALDEAR